MGVGGTTPKTGAIMEWIAIIVICFVLGCLAGILLE
jgi:hypothetical protein